jgi:hypothetical protein
LPIFCAKIAHFLYTCYSITWMTRQKGQNAIGLIRVILAYHFSKLLDTLIISPYYTAKK